MLGVVGTTGFTAMAGCSALLSTPCEPAKQALGDISIERDGHGYEYTNPTKATYEVRGTVLYVDDIEGLWIHDTTGCGRLASGKSGKVIDPEAFSPGDCVSVTGRLNVYASEEHGIPSVSAAELSNDGGSDAEVGPVGIQIPSVKFDVAWPDKREPMTLTLTDGSVTAGNPWCDTNVGTAGSPGPMPHTIPGQTSPT